MICRTSDERRETNHINIMRLARLHHAASSSPLSDEIRRPKLGETQVLLVLSFSSLNNLT